MIKLANNQSISTKKNLNDEKDLSINYKNTFVLDDIFSENIERSGYNNQDEEQNISDRKKILSKRSQFNNYDSSLNSANSENLENVTENSNRSPLQASKSDKELKSHILKNSASSKSPSQLNLSHKKENLLANSRPFSKIDVDSNKEILNIKGSKHIDSDNENFSAVRAQSSYLNHQRNVTTPATIQNFEKFDIFPYKSFYDITTDPLDENLRPITISVTQIDHESSGTSIKVNKKFINIFKISLILLIKNETKDENIICILLFIWSFENKYFQKNKK